MSLEIDLAWCLLMTCFSSVLTSIIWYIWKNRLEKLGYPVSCYGLLIAVCASFIIPVAGILVNLLDTYFYVWKGYMFYGSPTLFNASKIILKIWRDGCIAIWLYFCWQEMVFRYNVRNRAECSVKTKAVFRDICRELRLKEKHIQLATCYHIESPEQFGLFCPVILLPTEDYSDSELRFILYHELTHVRQKTAWVKLLSLTAVILQWFNPFSWLVRRNIFRWSEYICDDKASKYCGQKTYYTMLERITVKNKRRGLYSSSLQEKECNVMDRVRRAALASKRGKYFHRMLVNLCIAITLGVSLVTASTAAFAELFLITAKVTKVEFEIPQPDIPVAKTETAIPEGVILEMDNDLVLDPKSTDISWTISSGVRRTSQRIYLSAGQTVYFVGSLTPATATIKVGIMDDTNTSYTVTVSGSILSQINVTASGYYRIFVENTSGVNVTVNLGSLPVNAEELSPRIHIEYDVEQIPEQSEAAIYPVCWLEADEEKLEAYFLQTDDEIERVENAFGVSLYNHLENGWTKALTVYQTGSDAGIYGGFGYIYYDLGTPMHNYASYVNLFQGHPTQGEQIFRTVWVEDFLSEDDLDFMTQDEAKDYAVNVSGELTGLSFAADLVAVLDDKTLLSHAKRIEELGEDTIPEKLPDEAYMIWLSQIVDGLPVADHVWDALGYDQNCLYPTQCTVVLSAEGIQYMHIRESYQITEEGKKVVSLMSPKEALEQCCAYYDDQFLLTDIHIEQQELCYVPQVREKQRLLVPAWMFCISDEVNFTVDKKGEKISGRNYKHYVIDACSGEQLSR